LWGVLKFAFAVLLLMTAPAGADERLPWFGGQDQEPFQVTEDGDVVGSLSQTDSEPDVAQNCTIESCLDVWSSAKVQNASGISP
jgi:hypothetical protein